MSREELEEQVDFNEVIDALPEEIQISDKLLGSVKPVEPVLQETQILNIDEANPASLPEADLYVFSAAAEAFSLQSNMKTFMKNLEGMNGKKYGIINTHGMDKSRLSKMEKLLSRKDMIKVADVDFKIGKDIKSGNAFIGDWKSKLDDFAKKL